MQNLNERGAAYIPIAEARGITPHSDKPEHQIVRGIDEVFGIFVPLEGFKAILGGFESVHSAAAEIYPCGAVLYMRQLNAVSAEAVEFFAVVGHFSFPFSSNNLHMRRRE